MTSKSTELQAKVQALFDNPKPNEIMQIDFTNFIDDKLVKAISNNINLKNILFANLRFNSISDLGATYLGQNKTWINLQSLDLAGNLIGDTGAKKFALNQNWPSLKYLDLSENLIKDLGARAIASNCCWKVLRYLLLANNFISDLGAKAIGANTIWTKLAVLKLYGNYIGDAGAIALANNTIWKELEEIDLDKNIIGNEGGMAIAKSSSWSQLTRCQLSGNRIEEKGMKFIRENHKWKNLKSLSLYYENVSIGGTCNLCQKSINNPISQFYNYQNKTYYCWSCVDKIESLNNTEKIGSIKIISPIKAIDSFPLILIDISSTTGLSEVLTDRIGDHLLPTESLKLKNSSTHIIYCDVCANIIKNEIRWKCLNCKNLDMCNKCFLLAYKRDARTLINLNIRRHDRESHLLQRFVYDEKFH